MSLYHFTREDEFKVDSKRDLEEVSSLLQLQTGISSYPFILSDFR